MSNNKRFGNHLLAFGFIGFVALICLGYLVTNQTKNINDTNTAHYSMGEKFIIGDFEYVINEFKCGILIVERAKTGTVEPNGEYCRVNISVTNNTKAPSYFDSDKLVIMYDSEGHAYSSDSNAGIYGNTTAIWFLEEINPKNTINGNIYYDVPKGAKMTSITIASNIFSSTEYMRIKL